MMQRAVPENSGSENSGLKESGQLRIAFDVTPLVGAQTGVATLVNGFLGALRNDSSLRVVPYATTLRGRKKLQETLSTRLFPLPARALRMAWRYVDWPPVEIQTGEIDLVHGMNYTVPPTRSGNAVVSVHDLTFVRFPEHCTSDTLQYPTLLQRAFRRGAHVHVDSQYVADEVANWSGLSDDRIHVVNPGLTSLLDVVRVAEKAGGTSNSDSDPLHELGIRANQPFILGLGTIEPRKDFPTLVRAFGELASEEADLTLVLAGSNGWGIAALNDAMLELTPGARSRVFRLGYITGAQKRALLRQAQVLAYPSIYEGFGLPPLEAMQCGTPVVSSGAGSLVEVLGDAALLVDVGDVHNLAKQLLRVHTDDSLRLELIRRGRERVAMYTWERAGNELAGVYRSIVEGCAS